MLNKSFVNLLPEVLADTRVEVLSMTYLNGGCFITFLLEDPDEKTKLFGSRMMWKEMMFEGVDDLINELWYSDLYVFGKSDE